MSAKVLKHPTAAVLKSTPSRIQINNEDIAGTISKRSMSNSTDMPSPLEFVKFLPWVCMQFEITIEVMVKRAVVEKYVSRRRASHHISERKSSGRMKSSERKEFSTDRLKSSERKAASQHTEPSSKKAGSPPAPEKIESITIPSDAIPVTAYFDTSGHLVEVAIIKSPIKIQQKVIKCINMCLPFHASLLKFTITKGGLSSEVIYEIAKMLPISFITDVCLDDCYIKEGNYYILLDTISPLKVLSLKRCRINDTVIQEISKRIDFEQSASGLTVLDLGSNIITDKGLWYLGDVLRRNRNLLSLCLSENKITDIGVKYIMNSLKEFQMTQEEIYGMRKRRFQFIERIVTAKKEQEEHRRNESVDQGTQVHFRGKQIRKKTARKKKQSSFELSNVSTVTVIEQEEFTDIFDDHNVVVRDGKMYCIGNFSLCSLNLAYNELDILSIKKIAEVLAYQSKITKQPPRTGLMRLVIEGNVVSRDCDEMHEISGLLSYVISNASHSARILKSRSKF